METVSETMESHHHQQKQQQQKNTQIKLSVDWKS